MNVGSMDGPDVTIGFKRTSALRVRTPKSTSKSVRVATNAILRDTKHVQGQQETGSSGIVHDASGILSDMSESRYWMDSYGLASGRLGVSSNNASIAGRSHADYGAVKLEAASASVVHQVEFVPQAGGAGVSTGKRSALAVVAGPRVQMYGTESVSTFHAALKSNKRSSTASADRQITTAGQLALCASFRGDGRLVAIGTDRGVVRISDCTSRATFCQFGGDSPIAVPIRAVCWFRDGQHILSAGDDALIRIWQLKQQLQSGAGFTTGGRAGVSGLALECRGHTDSIRCAILWQMTDRTKILQQQQRQQTQLSYPYTALAATGSYDHSVRLWDMEAIDSPSSVSGSRCVSILQHGAPVEALYWMAAAPSTAACTPIWLLSAGAVTIKVWNPMNGTCVSTIQTQHRKTIACLLAMPRIFRRGDGDVEHRMRVLSGGLDGLIRIHTFDRSTGFIQHLHGINIGSNSSGNADTTVLGITALAATSKADRIAIGTTAGTVLVRQKRITAIKNSNNKRARDLSLSVGTNAFVTRGILTNTSEVIKSSDQIVLNGNQSDNASTRARSQHPRKLHNYDLSLKRFKYCDALDQALATKNAQVIIGVLEDLGTRRGLKTALSNRDEEGLTPILTFIARSIANPKNCEVLIGVTHIILDLYSEGTPSLLESSDVIRDLVQRVRARVWEECVAQKSAFEVLGQMDAILTLAEMEALQQQLL